MCKLCKLTEIMKTYENNEELENQAFQHVSSVSRNAEHAAPQPIIFQEQVSDVFEELEIKKGNPSDFYTIKGKVLDNLYKCERKVDKEMFTIKLIESDSSNLKNELITRFKV